MKAADLANVALLASCFACACAEGYGAGELGRKDNAALAPFGGVGGSLLMDAGAAGEMSTGGLGGMAAPVGVPCTQGDVAACPCEGTDVQGQRTCRFDMASPTQGFLTECQGCPPPAPPDEMPPDPEPSCTDGAQNGAETGVDCGGPDCMACAPDSDPDPEPDPPPDAAVDEEEPPPPDEPVQDCEGVPEGTECDRRCLLPFNVARCNSRGNCSCL